MKLKNLYQLLVEGVTLTTDGDVIFDFKNDSSTDILKLKYHKNLLYTRRIKDLTLFYSYKINADPAMKQNRIDLLRKIKKQLINTNTYDQLLSKAVIGLFASNEIDIKNTDVILIPESSSKLNFNIATKIKDRLPNAIFVSDAILKNKVTDVKIDYNALRSTNHSEESIRSIEKMVENAIVNGEFKIKKIAPRFRRHIFNFLKMDDKNKEMVNRIINGNILVVDDFVREGTTLREIKRALPEFGPANILFYVLIN